MKTLIAAVAALFVAGAAFAQTPMTKDPVKEAPQDARAAKDRDSMPKPNPNEPASGGAMQQEDPTKKK